MTIISALMYSCSQVQVCICVLYVGVVGGGGYLYVVLFIYCRDFLMFYLGFIFLFTSQMLT